MSTKMPIVEVGSFPRRGTAWLYERWPGGAAIRLDTPAWTAWLESATATSFAYAIADPQRGYITGTMTVRKERRQRGRHYWTVYRRCGRTVQKVYLGRSAAVTSARLAAIAWAFLCEERQRHGEEPPIAPSY